MKMTGAALCVIATMTAPAMAQQDYQYPWHPQPQQPAPQGYVYRPPPPTPADTAQGYLESARRANETGIWTPPPPPPRPVYCRPVYGQMVCN